MYAALWAILPGPVWLRVITATALAVGLLAILAFWVFPLVDYLLAPQEVTVQE
jgi:hypothetical protein